MNARIITSAVLVLCLIFTSCRSTRSYPNYPNYPDRREYPTSRYPGGNLPPGQAKKVYGYKSAKVFAPGQQKKYGKNYKMKSKKRKSW